MTNLRPTTIRPSVLHPLDSFSEAQAHALAGEVQPNFRNSYIHSRRRVWVSVPRIFFIRSFSGAAKINSSMASEAYASRNPDQVHTDVLLQARQACYKARDAFYDCVKNQSDKKPTELGCVGLLYPAECKKARLAYENSCRPSWVKHFDRLYCKEKRVQRLLDDKETRGGPLILPQKA
ncbi:unnamed protein product [Linum tenue]|uniref:Uncharacterized protein n=1 Tax=Linum tenue TaxID=586396 RepID=A0AAV0QDX0_9ROSI|nr:unnamed protein product [Linum tenue]